MSVALRLLTSGLATALGQWGLAIASLLAMGTEPTTWWLALSGVLTAAISILVYRLLAGPPEAPEDGGDPPSGGRDDEPDPPWWPDFERAFRDHVDRPQAPA